ncbi:MAG TPA: DUF2971 domain-containing protein [Bryobacteraceae bacterium]|nr:DUF2971 domain-containing protein [Bryobacteraceae bacterium]
MESAQGGPPDFVRATLGTSIFTAEPREHVYHYTTIEGVIGICTSRTIWATDVLYTNDASEYLYSSTIIEEVTKAHAACHPGFERYHWACHQNPLDLGLHVYASCFCEEKDLLSQWRAYARLGTGYAIEFSWAKLRNMFPQNRCGRVVYTQDTQKEILNQILTSLASDVTDRYPDQDARVAGGLANALLTVRAFLKSAAFREEKEWRIIAFHGTDIHEELYRPSNNLLVPYCALPLGNPEDIPITKIVIGPSLHPKAAEHSLRRFLDKIGLTGVDIDVSPIPLRV